MELNEIKARMQDGRLYFCDNEELAAQQAACLDKLYDYNHTRPSDNETRQRLLQEMFAKIGENCYIEQPFHANWAGKFCTFGKNVYANFNLTLVDDAAIEVGDDVLIGPNVTLVAGTHPIDPELRARLAQYNLPVKIGSRVWLGANVVVLPGVTIGEGSIIGAGSVVTKDIPANVVAVGSPCRVLRPITERDKHFYAGNRPVDVE